MTHTTTPEEIIAFWFSEPVKRLWFNANPSFDRLLRVNYLEAYEIARSGHLSSWQQQAEGSVALTILLDQFPLNMFRGEARSFATEEEARRVAKNAIKLGFDRALTDDQKIFIYMPFMHSESMDDQNYAVKLFENAQLTDNLKYATHHRDIIQRFGRFPHRNKILGRESTPEELEYLKSKDAFRG